MQAKWIKNLIKLCLAFMLYIFLCIFQDGDDIVIHPNAELVGSIVPTSNSYASVYIYTINTNGEYMCRRNQSQWTCTSLEIRSVTAQAGCLMLYKQRPVESTPINILLLSLLLLILLILKYVWAVHQGIIWISKQLTLQCLTLVRQLILWVYAMSPDL